jgi:sugar lactone lactonase YvrE
VSDFPEAIIRTDDGSFFTTEWYDKKIYRVKLEIDKLVPEIESSLEPAHPAGLAWNGKSLFVVTWTRGMGTKFHVVEMTSDLKTINTVRIKDIQEPDQLTWDGKNLWISSWHAKTVYKIDIDKWEIVGYFKSPVSKTTGIAWDGKYMWVTGTYGDLYQMEIGK